jgi:prepilin-type N-terminal cleavage/methylation domain-containing protein
VKKLKDATMPNVTSSERLGARSSQNGFSLLELMVALGITLVITGSMYGLIFASQGAFRREPALSDRQQQIRIALSRIREDVQVAGLGLGAYVQAFAENQNAVGVAGAAGAAVTGVRPAGDALLGGGLPDLLEIRAKVPDCPPLRVTQVGNSIVFQVSPGDLPIPSCYAPPEFVLAIFPSGAAKWAVETHTPGDDKLQFAVGQNKTAPAGVSQFTSDENASCDIYLPGNNKCPGAPGGPPAPPPPALPNNSPPYEFVKMDRIVYRLALDTDGTPSLFRSGTGGFDGATFNTLPPGPAWQVVGRGIEDFQIRYRTAAGWQNAAPTIAQPSLDNVVREVEVTMWARTVGENQLQGQTLAAGNGVTAVRASLTTSIAPRAAQMALTQETANLANRWQ